MRTLTIILSLICMAFTAGAAKADRRVAFVVGNGTYKNVAPLPNPPANLFPPARSAQPRQTAIPAQAEPDQYAGR